MTPPAFGRFEITAKDTRSARASGAAARLRLEPYLRRVGIVRANDAAGTVEYSRFRRDRLHRLDGERERGMHCRFGDFTFDRDTRRVSLDGSEVHLSPKAFDLLSVLITNRARAVSKAELQESIWPSTFVEETNIAGLVLEIRRALRDTASTPKYVRTIYGFGYHFIADVSEVGGSRVTEPSRTSFWLTFEHRQMPLMEGAQVIGRAPDAAIQIDLPGLSRHHARIVVAGGDVVIEDLGSKNGTLVNAQRIRAPVLLADGNEIRIGGAVLIFRIGSPTGPTATVAAASRALD